ncbi:hypothetical protein IU450_25510 [Nocardia abscessus]|uniref:hypothetical protein n=1 Tax=Nocardia abscessus TaxID=120957 RepID=UPI001896010C|nr:hypothetical protein [Nocardia abscessus]MBF6339224.1 hypothetical protein [Nocardia abscessus]
MTTCVRLGVDLDTTLSIVIGAIELVVDAAPATSPLTAGSGQVLRTVRVATGIVARAYGRAATRPTTASKQRRKSPPPCCAAIRRKCSDSATR